VVAARNVGKYRPKPCVSALDAADQLDWWDRWLIDGFEPTHLKEAKALLGGPAQQTATSHPAERPFPKPPLVHSLLLFLPALPLKIKYAFRAQVLEPQKPPEHRYI
jgi:hypothetical protein